MVFVDTGGWIAITVEADALHEVAKPYYANLLVRRVPFFSSNYVFDETLTRIRYNFGHDLACRFSRFYEEAENEHLITTLWVDEETIRQALQIFYKYSDQKFSFTDCTSFVLMKTFRINEAFAFDKHFETLGFTRFPHS